MRIALAPYTQRQFTREASVASFKQLTQGVAIHGNTIALGGAILGYTTAVATALALRGAAGTWAIGLLTSLSGLLGLGPGLIAGRAVGSAIDSKQRAKLLRSYVGWLDASDDSGQE